MDIQQITQNYCKEIATKEEELIRSVLPENLSPEEIAKRCEWTETPEERILTLDAEPILWLKKPVHKVINRSDRVILERKQEFITFRSQEI